VRKHMRFRIHALHRFGKLLFLRSRVFWRCHDVAEKLSRWALKICHGTRQSKSTQNNLCNFCNLILSFCYWHDLYVHISCYKINIYKLSKFAYVITYVTPCYKSSYIHIL
jgi:hypothetical protein